MGGWGDECGIIEFGGAAGLLRRLIQNMCVQEIQNKSLNPGHFHSLVVRAWAGFKPSVTLSLNGDNNRRTMVAPRGTSRVESIKFLLHV